MSELLDISDRKLHRFHRQCEGQTRPVLFEDTKVGQHICGFTDNYIKVRLPYDQTLANRIIPVRLETEILTVED